MTTKRRYFLVPIATAVATLISSPSANASISNATNYQEQKLAEGQSGVALANLGSGLPQFIASEEIHSLTLSNSVEGLTLASHRSHSSHSSHSSHRSHFSSR